MKEQEKYVRARLERMSIEGLQNLLAVEFGVTTGVDEKDALVDAVLRAQESVLEIQDDQDAPPPRKAEEQRIGLLIHNQNGPGGTDPVFASVNGRGYLIPREREVLLPLEVAEVLRNARSDVFERRGDGGPVEVRTVNRFAFTVVGAG